MDRGASKRPPLRILCVHGNAQVGEIFRSRLDSLERKLTSTIAPSPTLHFVDAPYLLPKRDGDDVSLRTWRVEGGEWAASTSRIAAAARDVGGVDGVLAFSQGVAAALVAIAAGALPRARFIIVAGGYLPRSLDADGTSPAAWTQLRSLHLIGTADTAVPPARSEALAACFASPNVLKHRKGHQVPTHSSAAATILAFVRARADEQAAQESAPLFSAPSLSPSAVGKDADANGGTPADPACEEAQAEELEVLESMHPGDALQLLSGVDEPTCFRVAISRVLEGGSDGGDDAQLDVALRIELPRAYPRRGTQPRVLDVTARMTGGLLSHLQVRRVEGWARRVALAASEEHLALQAEEEEEEEEDDELPLCFAFELIQAVESWLDEQLPSVASLAELPGCTDEAAADLAVENEALLQPADDATGKAIEEGDDETLALEATAEAERVDQIRREEASISSRSGSSSSSTSRRSAPTRSSFVSGTGRWRYTVGLVGKPSAGKSTLFNAACAAAAARAEEEEDGVEIAAGSADAAAAAVAAAPAVTAKSNAKTGSKDTPTVAAKIGSQPFTTILPNIGRGFASVPLPLARTGLAVEECAAPHGRSSAGDRLVPIIIKDVAGLIPGAYTGRGRGNAFLNDLLDADVLIHVIDASGETDRNGNRLVAEDVDEKEEEVGVEESPRQTCVTVDPRTGALRVRVRAKPNARAAEGVVALDEEEATVAVAAAAIDGAANKAIVDVLATALCCATSEVTLRSGHRARSKVFTIVASPERDAVSVFAQLLEAAAAAGDHRCSAGAPAAASVKEEKGGTTTSDGDSPLDEVRWVRLEIHRWISANVYAKWDRVRRKPKTLTALFSGYRANAAMVGEALDRCGLPRDAALLETACPSEFGARFRCAPLLSLSLFAFQHLFSHLVLLFLLFHDSGHSTTMTMRQSFEQKHRRHAVSFTALSHTFYGSAFQSSSRSTKLIEEIQRHTALQLSSHILQRCACALQRERSGGLSSGERVVLSSTQLVTVVSSRWSPPTEPRRVEVVSERHRFRRAARCSHGSALREFSLRWMLLLRCAPLVLSFPLHLSIHFAVQTRSEALCPTRSL